MNTATTLSPLDTKRLDKLAAIVEQGRRDINGGVFAIGAALFEANAIHATAGCKGQFSKWVDKHCNYSRQTAYNYVAIHEAFGELSNNLTIPSSALSVLTKSPEACRRAIQLDKIGKPVTVEKAKELVKEAKAKQPKSKPAAGFLCPNCSGTEADEDGDCVKCHEPREPGDDTASEAARKKAEAAARKASGKEKISPKERKEAMRAFGTVVRFIDKLGQHDACRAELAHILEIVKGTA